MKKAGSHRNGLQGRYFSQELLKNVIINFEAKKEIPENNPINLTEREVEVLKLICYGNPVKEIAEKLNISPRTVEGHKNRIMTKSGARNTSNLIMLSIKNKYIEI